MGKQLLAGADPLVWPLARVPGEGPWGWILVWVISCLGSLSSLGPLFLWPPGVLAALLSRGGESGAVRAYWSLPNSSLRYLLFRIHQ